MDSKHPLAGVRRGARAGDRIRRRDRTASRELQPAPEIGARARHTRSRRPAIERRPEDRDAIQRQVRHQLYTAGEQSGLLNHADSSAARVLNELLGRDGYTVEIVRSAALTPSTG